MLKASHLVRPHLLLRGVGLSLGLAAAAMAAPPVLDRVPTDALMVITAPSLERVNKGMETITASGALPQPIPNLTALLQMGGIEKGIDMTRSIAGVVVADAGGAAPDKPGADKAKPKKEVDADGEEDAELPAPPPMIVLVPITDYKALLANFNATAEPVPAGGIDTVEINGKPAYLKSIGDGYAALAQKKEVLEKFTGKAGNAKAHEAALGKACGAIADASDVTIIANFPAIKAQPGAPFHERLHRLAESTPMGMMVGGEEGLEGIGSAISSFMDQARIGVVGIKVDAAGVGLDMAAQFNEGTEMAKTFARSGNAAALVKKLPKQDYLLAFGADLSDPTIRDLIKKANPAGGIAADAGKDAEAVTTAMLGQLEKADGLAVSMGASAGAMMGSGFFTNTVTYIKTSQPDEVIKAGEQAAKTIDGKVINGTSITSTYTTASTKVNETPVDTWSVKLQPEEDSDMASQVVMGLFGPNGGPSGYVAKADGGVIRTLGKNSLLMSAALDAAKGNNSMSTDTLSTQVGEKLASGRMVEGYLGVKSLLDMVKPFLGMLGGGAEPEFPDVIPPVGFGLGGADGVGRASVYVPMPVIKAFGEISKMMKGAGDGDDEAPAPRRKPKDGAGQPRF